MHKAIVTAALLVTTSTIAFAQQDRATDITAAQVQQVLKATHALVWVIVVQVYNSCFYFWFICLH